MTGPKPDFTGPFNYGQQVGAMNQEINSAIAGTEFSAFMARRKELLDSMMAAVQAPMDPARHVDPAATDTTLVPVDPTKVATKPSADQIGQAHFWDIANPDQMSAAELQHQIDQRRLEVPKEQRTSLTSALFAGGAAAAASAGAAAEMVGHAFENIGAAAGNIPLIGPTLSSMLSNEQSKMFWQSLQSRASEAVEAASVMQPEQDKGAFQFMTGAGKMAGYTLPAIAAWEGLGAAAGIPRLSWAARAGTPLLRAAAKGALTAAILQDPDAPTDSKVMNIGLGAIMGGSSMWGKVGGSILLGTAGAGIGSQMGNTPEERRQHALEFGIGGATLPFLAPALANAFAKVRNAFPDGSIPAEGWVPPGTEDAVYTIESEAPQVSGNPIPKDLLGAGPTGEFSPQTPEDLHSLITTGGPPTGPTGGGNAPAIHSEGATPEVEPIPGATQPTSPAGPAALRRPQVAGLLETPGTADTRIQYGSTYSDMMEQVDHLRRSATDVEYTRQQLVDPNLSLDAPAATSLRFIAKNEPGTVADYFNRQADRLESAANATRYGAREFAAAKMGITGQVTRGPEHLLGSVVADAQGRPMRVYHGTDAVYDTPDLSLDRGQNLFGKGLYHTEDPGIASGYPSNLPDQATIDSFQASLARNADDLARLQQVEATGNAIGNTEAYRAHLEQERTSIQESLAQLQSVRPNVRPALLNIKNPYNLDQMLTGPEANQIIDRMEYFNPNYHWETVRDGVSATTGGDEPTLEALRAHIAGNEDVPFAGNGKISAEDLYRRMETVEVKNPEGPEFRGDLPLEDLPVIYNPETMLGVNLNDALANAGYDGITHIGGGRTGNAPHRVWIAFQPEQVHPYYSTKNMTTAEAIQTADAITKQATVMESATLPLAVGKIEMGEPDVVDALQSNNPGGWAVMKGVGRPMDVLAAHPDVTFVERDGRLDALVGEFTDEMKEDYQRFGTFEGNAVSTASGIEAEVVSISGKGMATLKRMGGGPPLRVKVSNLLPSRYADPIYEGKDLWPSFKADFLRYMNEEMSRAGMAPVENLYDPRATSMMQGHMEDYLNRRGIRDAGTRHAIQLSLNQSWVEETRALDPESRAIQERQGDQATLEANDREEGPEPIPYSLEERAEPRGFVWISNPNADGGILRDALNPEGAAEFPMATDEAAEKFLDRVDRTAPDITPASDVPVETMEFAPTGSSFEPVVGHDETSDQFDADVGADDRQLDELEGAETAPSTFVTRNADGTTTYNLEAHLNYLDGLNGGGGGGAPPVPPDVPVGGGYEPPDQPQLGAGRQETLGDQFQRLYRDSPETWAGLERRWAGNHLRYTRYLMGALENDLVRNGVSLGRAWRDVEALETARTKADNESHDWLKEGGDIMRSFGSRRKVNPLFRNGFITRTHEITEDPERFRRWWGLRDKGFSDAEIKQMIAADARLTDIYHRLFMSGVESPDINFRPEQEINRYISHVRQRQAQGIAGQDVYNHDGLLSPEVQFFAEYARQGNMQFRVMDTRALFNHYVRSMMFKKYQAAPYERLVRNWQDPRIPENIRTLLTDHAKAMRFGYRPEPTLAVKAIRGTIEGMLGVPMTTSEAARVASGPLGWLYRSLLGGKTSIFFRDATQPLMALSKVKAGHMADAYNEVLGYWRGGTSREQMLESYDLALRHGWVSRERPAMEALSTFEEQAGSDNQLLALTPEQARRREIAARIGDVALPSWLERFDDKVNTLRLYGKEQRLNQFIPGLAAYRQAKAGLGEYRQLETQAALSGDPSKAMSYDDMASKTFFSSFEPAIQARLKELVQSGNDEEAAATFAREVVKWSQHVYTVREKPAVLRGGFGRFASFLGNWSGQFLEAVHSSLRYGEPQHRARALMVLGGFSYAMYKLGEKLGMRNLSHWAWTSALNYAGSPLLERAAQGVLAYGGIMGALDDRKPDPMQGEAIQQLPTLLQTGGEFFPYSGYGRSADAIVKATQGTTRAADVARFMISGDRGSRIDFLLKDRSKADSLRARLEASPYGSPPTNSTHPGTGARQ